VEIGSCCELSTGDDDFEDDFDEGGVVDGRLGGDDGAPIVEF